MPDNRELLWKSLREKGLYSKSQQEFNDQFSTPERQALLHKKLADKELYSKGEVAFRQQFFDSNGQEQPTEPVYQEQPQQAPTYAERMQEVRRKREEQQQANQAEFKRIEAEKREQRRQKRDTKILEDRQREYQKRIDAGLSKDIAQRALQVDIEKEISEVPEPSDVKGAVQKGYAESMRGIELGQKLSKLTSDEQAQVLAGLRERGDLEKMMRVNVVQDGKNIEENIPLEQAHKIAEESDMPVSIEPHEQSFGQWIGNMVGSQGPAIVIGALSGPAAPFTAAATQATQAKGSSVEQYYNTAIDAGFNEKDAFDKAAKLSNVSALNSTIEGAIGAVPLIKGGKTLGSALWKAAADIGVDATAAMALQTVENNIAKADDMPVELWDEVLENGAGEATFSLLMHALRVPGGMRKLYDASSLKIAIDASNMTADQKQEARQAVDKSYEGEQVEPSKEVVESRKKVEQQIQKDAIEEGEIPESDIEQRPETEERRLPPEPERSDSPVEGGEVEQETEETVQPETKEERKKRIEGEEKRERDFEKYSEEGILPEAEPVGPEPDEEVQPETTLTPEELQQLDNLQISDKDGAKYTTKVVDGKVVATPLDTDDKQTFTYDPDEFIGKVQAGTFQVGTQLPASQVYPELAQLEQTLGRIPKKADKLDISDMEGEIFVKPIPRKTTKQLDPRSALKKVAGKDELRPAMTGVLYDAENQQLVATDGHVLTVIPQKVKGETRIESDAVKTGIIDEKFPDYINVIPEDHTHSIKGVDPVPILDQARGSVKAKKFTAGSTLPMVINFDDGRSIAFNPDVTYNALNALVETGTKEIDIEASELNRAVIFRDSNNPDKFSLIMPMMFDRNEQGNPSTVYTTLTPEVLKEDPRAALKSAENKLKMVKKGDRRVDFAREAVKDREQALKEAKAMPGKDKTTDDAKIAQRENAIETISQWLKSDKDKLKRAEQDWKKQIEDLEATVKKLKETIKQQPIKRKKPTQKKKPAPKPKKEPAKPKKEKVIKEGPFRDVIRDLGKRERDFKENPTQKKYDDIVDIHVKLWKGGELGNPMSAQAAAELGKELDQLNEMAGDKVRTVDTDKFIDQQEKAFKKEYEQVQVQTTEIQKKLDQELKAMEGRVILEDYDWIPRDELRGKEVKMDVEIIETGNVEEMSMSAVEAHTDIKKRHNILKKLTDCVG